MEIKKDKKVKIRTESVNTSHLVEVWRLLMDSLREGGQIYPDTSEDNPDEICSQLFKYMNSPYFFGLIARAGRRPVGILLGHVSDRTYGRPKNFAFVWCFWVDKKFRKQKVGMALWNDFSALMKKNQILNWESHAHDHLFDEIKGKGIPVNKFLNVIGGRL